MISFGLDEEQQLIQETVRKFAAAQVRPQLRAWERAGAVPEAARRAFHELGLGLLEVPEALGGGGASTLTAALAHEELAVGDPGAAVALWAPHMVAAALCELGTAAQAKRWLEPFVTDAKALGAVAIFEPLGAAPTRATPRPDGSFTLSGKKAFVVNGGAADVTVVFAVDEGGAPQAFVVEKGAPGCKRGARHELLGLQTVDAAEIILDGCVVPAAARLDGSGDFGERARRFQTRVALVAAARQVGLARAAYEFALEYTQERKAFGKPVAHFQAIAFTLAEMHMDVESARWMVWRAASMAALDAGLVAQAAVHANDAAWRVADNAVQLLGGAGFVQDYPVEKWLRDTKALALFAPPTELLQLELGAIELDAPALREPAASSLQPNFT